MTTVAAAILAMGGAVSAQDEDDYPQGIAIPAPDVKACTNAADGLNCLAEQYSQFPRDEEHGGLPWPAIYAGRADLAAAGAAPEQRLVAALYAAMFARADARNDPTVVRLVAEGGNFDEAEAMVAMLWPPYTLTVPWDAAHFPEGYATLLRNAAKRPQDGDMAKQLMGARIVGSDMPDLIEGLMRQSEQAPDLDDNGRLRLAMTHLHYGREDDFHRLMAAGGFRSSEYDAKRVEAALAAHRLSKGYDAEAARLVLESADLENRLEYNDGYKALKAAGAKAELRLLADRWLENVRRKRKEIPATSNSDLPMGAPRDVVRAFADASAIYLAAGETALAQTAAREGLTLLPLSVARLAHYRDPTVVATPEGRREIAEHLDGDELSALFALYAAGARDEALRTGYLLGRHRYGLALEAGEAPDPAWIIQDNAQGLNLAVLHLGMKRDRAAAAALHDAVAAHGKPLAGDVMMSELPQGHAGYQVSLGLMSAIAGRKVECEAHFMQAMRIANAMELMVLPELWAWSRITLRLAEREAA